MAPRLCWSFGTGPEDPGCLFISLGLSCFLARAGPLVGSWVWFPASCRGSLGGKWETPPKYCHIPALFVFSRSLRLRFRLPLVGGLGI